MASVAPITPATQPKPRLHYLDTLKVCLTILVVLHHAGQPYGPGGWWYVPNPERVQALGPFFHTNASFFMGLFFFISAVFLPGSVDRKGPGAFLRDRLQRIGIPLVLGFLTIIPALMYAYYLNFRGGTLSFFPYMVDVFFGAGGKPAGWTGPSWPDMQFAHLWFVEHLLVYGLLYAGWRALRRGAPVAQTESEPPGHGAILLYVLALTAVNAVVRIWYPIDRWIGILGFIQAEIAHLPQYASLFVLGLVAARKGWLHSLKASTGYTWLAVGLGAVALRWAEFAFGGIGLYTIPGAILLWENLVCVGLVLGLLTLFKEKVNRRSAVWDWLSANAFAVYIFHVPVLAALEYAVLNTGWGPWAKFLVTGAVAVPLTFALSHLLRKLPLLRSIL